MKLRELRLKTNHPAAYQPDGCSRMSVTSILWDEEHNRICLSVRYDSGHLDWIPLTDLTQAGHYSIDFEKGTEVEK